MWSPHTKFKVPYSDVLKPYSGVLELDLPKLEFHAFIFIFLFFKFDRALLNFDKIAFRNKVMPLYSLETGKYYQIFLKKWVKC